MSLTRRAFAGGLVASPLVVSGLMAEVRADHSAVMSDHGVAKPARILFNENPLGPSPKALKALAKDPSLFARYPLSKSFALAMRLRELNGLPFVRPSTELSLRSPALPPANSDLVLGVGSSELLHASVWAFAAQANEDGGFGNIVEAYPGYAAIGGQASRVTNGKINRRMVPLNAKGEIDPEAMINAIDSQTRIVVICNPNNPTGTFIPFDSIERICDAAPKQSLVIVDEAYIEFVENSEGVSALSLAKSRENVLVTRTFSKIYGLAGLRLGYGIGATGLIERLKPHMLGRLSMNMPAILAAEAALEDPAHLDATLKLNREIQETWKSQFSKYGYRMTPSITCFGWVNLGFDCTPLVQFLRDRGVLISGGQRWDLPQCVRISIGTHEENDRLLAGIRAFHQA